MVLNLSVGVPVAVVLGEVGQEPGVLLLLLAFLNPDYLNPSLVLVTTLRILYKIRVQVYTQLLYHSFQFFLILLWVRDWRSCQSHYLREDLPFLQILTLLDLLLYIEVELVHNTSVWVVAFAVMAFVEHDERKVSHFDEASSQAVQEHLGNYDDDR